jgi:hypothetical protein
MRSRAAAAGSAISKEGGFMSSFSVRTAVLCCGALLVESRLAFPQQTLPVSVSSSGHYGNGRSDQAAISADGRFIAFVSQASDLVIGDANGMPDVFVHDCLTGATERVSVDSSGAEGNGYCRYSSISADGRFVAFASYSSNLVPNDTNGGYDVFVHDRTTGVTERVSVDSSGAEGNDWSGWSPPSISGDGRYVAFDSWATNLVAGDTNDTYDVFVHDRVTGVTERVSVDSLGIEADGSSGNPAISDDGRCVGFWSAADDLVANDTNGESDAFVHDRIAGTTERVSVSSTGVEGNGSSGAAGISADGNIVAFLSSATNLVVGDTTSNSDVFVHDRSSGVTERMNVSSSGQEGDGSDANDAAISRDGRFVTFSTDDDNLVDHDVYARLDVFVHDRSTGVTTLISLSSSGAQGDGDSLFASISSDGRFVAFESWATNLGAAHPYGMPGVFVRDRGPISTWSNYGAGYPGTAGVPTFTARTDPVVGTSLTLDLSNSHSDYTVGVLFVGFRPTTVHSTWGGDLLVDPVITTLLGISPWGTSVIGDIPDDDALAGLEVDLQAFEVDPGAAKGVSFTPGLQLILGH